MVTITPLSVEESKKKKEDEDVGFFESAFAGVVTGLWNIPKGFVSLGAELMDLVGDTNLAKGVEQWFDDTNPFDDEAEARLSGKITQALTQIGIPAVKGFQIGSGLARKALLAKKTGKHMSMSIMGKKIMAPTIGSTTGGVIGGGIGEAIVADEDIGTFGDILQGTSLEPFAVTMMDREDKEGRSDAYRKLKNRLKFGTEGALFNLALIGAGKGIKSMGEKSGITEYSKNAFQRGYEKFGLQGGLSPSGNTNAKGWEELQYRDQKIKAVTRETESLVKKVDQSINSIKDDIYDSQLLPDLKLRSNSAKNFNETSGKQAILKNLQEALSPTGTSNLENMLKPEAKQRAINELKLVKQFENLEQAYMKSITERNPSIFRKELQKVRRVYVKNERREAKRLALEQRIKASGGIDSRPGIRIKRTADGQLIEGDRIINKSIALKKEFKEAAKNEIDELALLGGRENFKQIGKNAFANLEVLEEVVKYQGKITPQAQKEVAERAFNSLEKLKDNIRSRGSFTDADYRVTPKLKETLGLIEKYGSKESATNLQRDIINLRKSTDNLSSYIYGKPINRGMERSIGNNFGRYFSASYRAQDAKRLTGWKILDQYKVTDEEILRAKDKYIDQSLINSREDFVNKKIIELKRPATISERNAFEEQALREAVPASEYEQLVKNADSVVDDAAKKLANDEVPPMDLAESNVNAKELQGVKIKGSVLEKKVLQPWQEELFGIVRDPTYTFMATTGKLANVNFTADYFNKLAKLGAGKNGFVKSELEISNDILNKKELGGNGTTEDVINLRERLLESDDGIIKLQQADLEARRDLADPLKWRKFESNTNKMATGLDNKYIQAPQYEGLLDVTNNFLNSSNVGTFYKYAILGPKAGSQITKTILSPLTHIRNLLSAGAFVAANGAFFPTYGDFKMLMPASMGGENVFKQAYGLTGKRILGTMTDADELFYQRLLNVGVTDSQVQAGEMKRLIRDMINDPAKVERSLGDRLPANLRNKSTAQLRKTYEKIQDAYVAEDDFWKIINWSLERNRYGTAVKNLGINKDNIKTLLYADPKSQSYKNLIAGLGESGEATASYFRKAAPRDSYIQRAANPQEMMDNFLDEVAGNLTRNQVPNYAYIGRTGRALRMSPFGNFIAFPLEIMRTGHNIFERSILEINSGVPGLKELGYKRLFSFGATVGGVPYGLTEMFKAKNDVTDQEMDALRKFVPEWSKNSTLLPTGRDEDGNLKYVDFSYSNAYDTLIRPFNAVVGALGRGENDPNSLKAALGEGMADSMVEILKPYATESMFSEALIDATFRKGIGSRGKRVWSDRDETMVKIAKGVMHVGEAFKPGSLNQLVRMGRAARGKTDEYGQMYNLKDELSSLYGMREITSNPIRSLRYMTTEFGSKLKQDNNLFIGPLLKGGRISPEEIINKYRYSQSRKFETVKEMYQNIRAARILGVSESDIRKNVTRKGIDKETTQNLFRGVYTPQLPNEFFVNKVKEITRNLNNKENLDLPNPYQEALPSLREIITKNRRLDLENEKQTFYEELETQIEPPTSISQSIQPLRLNPNPTNITQSQPAALNTNQNNNVNIATQLTSTEEALLSPGDQIIRKRQRQQGTA